MKIVLFGATGMIGSRIAQELQERGHEITAATRATGADAVAPDSVARVASGADAIVSAVSARSGEFTLTDVAHGLLEGARRAGVRRVIVVGGAATLEVAPGKRLLDTPDFPEEWKAEAIQGAESLEAYRQANDVDWTFVSPAAYIHPGERRGSYRLGGDELLVDEKGTSEISAEDYAIAIADLLETHDYARTRVSVAW
jgi:putative NADH-flavin reductase